MMQLGEGLAGLLPPAEAKAARKELGEIGVRVIRVGTLFDQMSFDKERLVVQAGKPVEFVFENTDIMPHNFVIVAPGKLEKVGNAAEAFATAARRGRGAVRPDSRRARCCWRASCSSRGKSSS